MATVFWLIGIAFPVWGPLVVLWLLHRFLLRAEARGW